MRLAMGQMLVEGGQPVANLARAVEMIREAADRGAHLVVLPECLDLGWTDSSALSLAEPIPGRFSQILAEAASKFGIFVVAGLVEGTEGSRYNAAILLSPAGEILLKHRKINELAIAHHLYATGDRLGVSKTSLGVVGLNICADNAPGSLVLGHALARMGAEILLSPSAWAVPHDYDPVQIPYGAQWKAAYRHLAEAYAMPVIGVSNVGEIRHGAWQGWRCIGNSLAVDAQGNVLATGSFGEHAAECILVDVDVKPRVLTGTDLVDDLQARGYGQWPFDRRG